MSCGVYMSGESEEKPLTVDQLYTMHGQPVFVIAKPDPNGLQQCFWALVEVGIVYPGRIFLNMIGGNRKEIGEMMQVIDAIYRTKPDDLFQWPGLDYTINESLRREMERGT